MAVVAVAATGAFFSDTETSQDNTFQAGALDLQIDSECHYFQNGIDVGCFHLNASPTPSLVPFGNWPLGNLTFEKFFWFADVKPGDYGENTISTHVFNNDAWMCLNIGPLENNGNGLTEPEDVIDNDADGPGQGELAQNLNFFAWLDDGTTDGFQCPDNGPAPCQADLTEGDNIFQQGELPLFTNGIGPAIDVLNGRTYTLADSTGSILGSSGTPPTPNPFVGSTTYYIGVAWCAGAMTSVGIGGNMPGGLLNCNGTAMGNDTQTDSMTADLTFYAEQWRNNPSFKCQDQFGG